MRVLALASYDSFLNTARLIAPYYERSGAKVELALVKARKTAQIADSQIKAAGLEGKVRWVDIETLCSSGEIARYDVVLSCLEGLSTRRLAHHLRALGENRPVVVSIYPGVVIRFAQDGFSMRTASDFVWLNSPDDVSAYAEMCRAFDVDPGNARVFGVASVLKPVVRAADSAAGPVVFFEQAVIPRYQSERAFMVEQLLMLARRNPDRRFLVKPRTTGAEATLHQAWHQVQPLMRRAARTTGGWPANLEITELPADRLLAQASHCLTISSTVAIEAIYAGVPTAIISDFGAHDDYGLHYFYGSDLMRTFDALRFPFEGVANADWLAARAADPRLAVEALVAETIAAVGQPRRAITNGMVSAEYSPALRTYLVGRHGVDRVLGRAYQKMPANRKFGLQQLWKMLRRMRIGNFFRRR